MLEVLGSIMLLISSYFIPRSICVCLVWSLILTHFFSEGFSKGGNETIIFIPVVVTAITSVAWDIWSIKNDVKEFIRIM